MNFKIGDRVFFPIQMTVTDVSDGWVHVKYDNGTEDCREPGDFARVETSPCYASIPMPAWADSENSDDQNLPEDEEIDAAFPTRSGRHDLYAKAMRLVGAKRSKAALVSLVTWLLLRAEK